MQTANFTKKAKNVYVYATICQTLFSKLKCHLVNAAYGRKTSLAQKHSVFTANLLTFGFRSIRRLNNSITGKEQSRQIAVDPLA